MATRSGRGERRSLGLPVPSLAAVAIALLLPPPPAAAHGPPVVRDQDTRLLADHNDDCGGDDAGALENCRGSHDLVSLDLREAYDEELGNVVVFRLLMNLGEGGAEL